MCVEKAYFLFNINYACISVFLEEAKAIVERCTKANVQVVEGAKNNLPDSDRNSIAICFCWVPIYILFASQFLFFNNDKKISRY